MTREEAIKIIRKMLAYTDLTVRANLNADMVSACNLAIKALEQEPTTKNDLVVDAMPKVVIDTQNCPCRSLNDVCCIALKNCYEDDIATPCPLVINGTEINNSVSFVMENELNKAGLDVKVEKVPNSRCASSSSVRELNEKIKYRIDEIEKK